MKILVTGGAGYIGSVLVPKLLESGFKVTVIDDFRYGQTSLLECCHHRSFDVIRGDARDKQLISRHLKEADFILPLACLTGAPICDRDPHGAKSINFDAVKSILDLKSRNQGVIFPNTNSGYGVGQKDIYCTEDSPLNPISLYGRLKVELESLLMSYENTVSLRLATVFGISPRMRLDLLVNDFTYRAVRDRFIVLYEGRFKRNFIHVRDVAKAFLHCLNRFDGMKNNIYNIGLSDANLSKIELCQIIQEFLPDFYCAAADLRQDPDQRNYIVSNEKIEKSGYLAEISLRYGIEELIKGFQILSRNQFSNI